MPRVLMRVVLLLVAFALVAPAGSGAATKRYAFPESWVAKKHASLVRSTGNKKIQCRGDVRVHMRAGGFGYLRIRCQPYIFTIDPATGHVRVAAVA